MLPSVCAAFCSNRTLLSEAKSSTSRGTAPRSKTSVTVSSCSVRSGSAPTALKRIKGESRDSKPMRGLIPPSCRTECCTVSSCARFQRTPAAFSTTVPCSECRSLIKRPTAPAWAMARRFSCVSARHDSAPRQFSSAGAKVDDPKTPRRKGMPPAFRSALLLPSAAARFQRALAAFSCSRSSVGWSRHCTNALTPPACITAAPHSASAARFVSVMAATALDVSRDSRLNIAKILGMPSRFRTCSLQTSSTARFRMAPAAATRVSSCAPGSSRSSSSSTPWCWTICTRSSRSRAKLPRHSADLPTVAASGCLSSCARAGTAPCPAISALLSPSTLRFLRAPAAARTQAPSEEPSKPTSVPVPPNRRTNSRFSRSRAKFSRQFAARSRVRV
mmetsp:Transcript_49538/g.147963  ORF Transcript_49538/g.147963 Transcript_49538/m.147963 type:complete len:389 (+) Transcript_49538:636-1802(+)